MHVVTSRAGLGADPCATGQAWGGGGQALGFLCNGMDHPPLQKIIKWLDLKNTHP